MGYYDLDLVSQSRLNVVHSLMYNLPIMKAKRETLEFGKQLHEYVLESEVYALKLATNEPYYRQFENKIRGMGESVKANDLVNFFLSQSNVLLEQDKFFTHERTGIKCKLKADILLRRSVADLKTTATKTKAEFEATILKYGYHRQGAFYIDGTGSKEFNIIAVSKTHPYPTFNYTLKSDDPRIIQGREEIEILMDEYVRLLAEGVDFMDLMKIAA